MENRPSATRQVKPAKPEQANRRAVLGVICRTWFNNNKSALAAALDVSPGYVNNILAGRKPIADQAARNACSKLEIPQGSLDTPLLGPLGPRDSKPFHKRGLSMLSETMQLRILKIEEITDEKLLRVVDSAINSAYEAQVSERQTDQAGGDQSKKRNVQ
jgi:hypothetical protein